MGAAGGWGPPPSPMGMGPQVTPVGRQPTRCRRSRRRPPRGGRWRRAVGEEARTRAHRRDSSSSALAEAVVALGWNFMPHKSNGGATLDFRRRDPRRWTSSRAARRATNTPLWRGISPTQGCEGAAASRHVPGAPPKGYSENVVAESKYLRYFFALWRRSRRPLLLSTSRSLEPETGCTGCREFIPAASVRPRQHRRRRMPRLSHEA